MNKLGSMMQAGAAAAKAGAGNNRPSTESLDPLNSPHRDKDPDASSEDRGGSTTAGNSVAMGANGANGKNGHAGRELQLQIASAVDSARGFTEEIVSEFGEDDDEMGGGKERTASFETAASANKSGLGIPKNGAHNRERPSFSTTEGQSWSSAMDGDRKGEKLLNPSPRDQKSKEAPAGWLASIDLAQGRADFEGSPRVPSSSSKDKDAKSGGILKQGGNKTHLVPPAKPGNNGLSTEGSDKNSDSSSDVSDGPQGPIVWKTGLAKKQQQARNSRLSALVPAPLAATMGNPLAQLGASSKTNRPAGSKEVGASPRGSPRAQASPRGQPPPSPVALSPREPTEPTQSNPAKQPKSKNPPPRKMDSSGLPAGFDV
jgi:hypothetical protein